MWNLIIDRGFGRKSISLQYWMRRYNWKLVWNRIILVPFKMLVSIIRTKALFYTISIERRAPLAMLPIHSQDQAPSHLYMPSPGIYGPVLLSTMKRYIIRYHDTLSLQLVCYIHPWNNLNSFMGQHLKEMRNCGASTKIRIFLNIEILFSIVHNELSILITFQYCIIIIVFDSHLKIIEPCLWLIDD